MDVCEDGLKSVMRGELEEKGRVTGKVLRLGHLFHEPGVNAVVAEVDVLQGPFDPRGRGHIANEVCVVEVEELVPVVGVEEVGCEENVEESTERQGFLFCGMGLACFVCGKTGLEVACVQEGVVELEECLSSEG